MKIETETEQGFIIALAKVAWENYSFRAKHAYYHAYEEGFRMGQNTPKPSSEFALAGDPPAASTEEAPK